jgi:hypothetical protein
MRRGTCVKCGATEVRAARNGLRLGEYHQPQLNPHLEPGFRGAVRSLNTEVWVYGCTACGYLELHTFDPAALQLMGETWLPVPVTS